MLKPNFVLRAADEGGGGGATADAAATATAATGAASAGAAAATGTAAAGGATGAQDAAATGATAAGKTGDAKATAEVKGIWPENWRETVSKADEKRLTQLQRYQSPEAAIQALFAAQDRIRSGELKPVLGKTPTPEDLKEWREAHGIPETPDKYDLGKDVQVDEADAPFIAEVMKAAHGSNQTPEQVKSTVKAWNEIKKAAFDAQAAKDQQAKTSAEDVLRAEWGPEYRRNENLIHGLFDGATSPDLKDKLLSGRLSDGTPVGSSPEAMKLLLALALIQNPTGVVVPGGDANRTEGIEAEIAKIEKVMKENRTTYNKDEKMQARYRELLGALEVHKGKAKA